MSSSSFWEGTDAEIITPSTQKDIGKNASSLNLNANPSNFWEGTDAEIIPNSQQNGQDQQQNPSIGNRIASGGKAIAAGALGSIPDTAALVYNLPATLHNALARHNQNLPDEVKQAYEELVQHDPKYANYLNTTEIPTIPSATEAIDRGIDHITGGYTETPEDQKYINEALKAGSSLATFGGVGKIGQQVGSQVMSKTGNLMGSLEKSQIAGAGAAGATSSYLADQGASTPESIGGALTAQLLTTYGAKKAPKLVGFNKNNINLDLATATKDLDIPLENSLINKSKVIKLADNFLDKLPLVGKNTEKRQAIIGEKVLKELDHAYDSVLNSKELAGVENRITKLYNRAEEILPENAKIVPQRTINAIDDINSKIKTLAPSTDEKELLSTLDTITNNIGSDNTIHVGYLSGTKRSLNTKIKWDIQDGGVKDLLKNVQHALKEDMVEYGIKNPEWHSFFTKADSLYSKVAKREKLEDLLTGKAVNDATGELSYNNLSKVLHNKKTSSQLQQLVEPEIFDRLKKLGTVARAITIKDKALRKQSSKLAAVQSAAKVITGITGIGGVGIFAPYATGAAAIASLPIAHLLGNRKFLDATISFAENPTYSNAITFNQRMKAITGYTPVTLMREASKLEQEKQVENPNVIEISNPLKKHTEENKSKPKGQALNELLENPYVNGFGKSLSNPWPQK